MRETVAQPVKSVSSIPSLLFCVAVAAQFIADTAMAMPLPLRLLGIPLLLAGSYLPIAGAVEFRKHRTTVLAFNSPAALVTSGVYRYTRNPMYAGMVLVLLALAVLLGQWVNLLVVPVFMLAMYAVVIRWEERQLLADFGSEYADYRARTPRWLLCI